jgi:hypothetical protein
MTDVTAQPPVTAALENADGTANIYVTEDPSVNQLTLTLTAAPGVDVHLPAGAPVQYGDLPSGQSAVYLFFDGLLANAEIVPMHFTAPGWTSKSFTDPNSTLQYLVIAPGSDVTLAGGGALSFSMTNVLVAEQPTSGTADVVLAGATGISPGDADLSLFVNVADPPHPGDKVLDLDIGFDIPDLYTGQADQLVLHLINTGDGPLVPGGSGAWGPKPPTFKFTVLYGDGVGDLTALDDAQNISGAIADTYGNVWKPVDTETQGKKRSWQMQPDPNGGGTVLGTGEQATIEFSFSGIDPALPAGLDEAITVTYVSWSSVPGYKDGSLGVPVTKRAGPAITTFTADPGIVPYGATSFQTTLTWVAAHADSVSFDVPGVPPSNTYRPQGSGPNSGIAATPGRPLGITAYKTIAAAKRELGDDQISASTTLVLPQVKRVDLSVAGPPFVVAPPGVTGYAFNGTSCTEIDLTKMSVTRTWDLAAAVKNQLPVRGVLGVTSSPDGSRLHVAVFDQTYNAWLLEVDPAAATVTSQVSLGVLGQGQSAQSASLAASPDGTTLYVSTLVQTFGSSIVVAPYALYVIDVGSYSVTTTFPWANNDAQGTIVAAADSGRVVMDGLKGPAVLETAGGVRVASSLDLTDPYKQYANPRSQLMADGSTLYISTIDATTYDENAQTANLALVVVDVDAKTGALSFARKVPFELQVNVPAEFIVDMLVQWGGGTVALSQDEKTLYFLFVPQSIAVVSLEDMSVQIWGCDPGVFLMYPLVIGAQAGAVYGMKPGGPLYAVSVGPASP